MFARRRRAYNENMDIDKIRNETLTEDAKMEMIADYIQASGQAGPVIVDLVNLSGTLSDEDYANVLKDNCIVKVSTEYFYKQFSASTVITYASVPRISANKEKAIFDSVEIEKSSKSYAVKSETFPAA